MKSILLVILFICWSKEESNFFRITNGVLKIGAKSMAIKGSIVISKLSADYSLVGVAAIDETVMEPYELIGVGNYIPNKDVNVQISCNNIMEQTTSPIKSLDRAFGSLTVIVRGNSARVNGRCKTTSGKFWDIMVTGDRSNQFYSYEEAAIRARSEEHTF